MSEQQQVGCEREDGTLNVHPESESCEVCAPPPARAAADLRERLERFKNFYRDSGPRIPDGVPVTLDLERLAGPNDLTVGDLREAAAALSHAEQAQARLEQERDGHLRIMRIILGKVAIGAASLPIADLERLTECVGENPSSH